MKPFEFKHCFHDSCPILLKHILFVRTNQCPLYLCLFQIRGRHFMFHDMLWLTDPCLNLRTHTHTHTPSVFVIQGTQVFMAASVLYFLPCNIKTLETSTSILCMRNGLFIQMYPRSCFPFQSINYVNIQNIRQKLQVTGKLVLNWIYF